MNLIDLLSLLLKLIPNSINTNLKRKDITSP